MSEFVYKKIKRYIMELMRENNYDPEFKLPSDNQLALKFNASRISVRKAFTELEEEGLIERLRGKGTFAKMQPKVSETDLPKIALILHSSETFFFNRIIMGADRFCNENGFTLVTMFSFNSPESETHCIEKALKMGVSGILLVPLATDNYSKQLLSLSLKKIPVVLIDHNLIGLGLPCVSSNHYEIMYTATNYLCKRGHTNIMLVSSNGKISSLFDRMTGYEDAMQHFNNSYSKHIFVPDYDHPKNLNIEYTDYLRKNRITAAVTPSGDMALRLAYNMQLAGKHIGKDYDMVVIDEESYYLQSLLNHKIPTVIQDGEAIGYSAGEQLYKSIQTGTISPHPIYIPFRFDY